MNEEIRKFLELLKYAQKLDFQSTAEGWVSYLKGRGLSLRDIYESLSSYTFRGGMYPEEKTLYEIMMLVSSRLF